MSTVLRSSRPIAVSSRRRRDRPDAAVRPILRRATAAEAPALHSLISAHAEEGRLLPRHRGELTIHAPRFVVAVSGSDLIGCAELAPLSESTAEIRSLVVNRQSRRRGIGTALVNELLKRAEREGFVRLCAFTHDAAYFVRMGFSIVPHTWLPEKIAVDCQGCPQFRRCGQHAVVRSLTTSESRRPEQFGTTARD